MVSLVAMPTQFSTPYMVKFSFFLVFSPNTNETFQTNTVLCFEAYTMFDANYMTLSETICKWGFCCRKVALKSSGHFEQHFR